MKVVQKILVILLIAMCVTIVMPQGIVNAAGAETQGGTKFDLNSTLNLNATVPDSGGLQKVVNNVLGFLQVASALIAVIMIAVTGFRYIVETPDMKSELKKSMIPIIVGILLVFFAVTIAKFFVGLFQNGSN